MSNRTLNWLGCIACAALLTMPLVGAPRPPAAAEKGKTTAAAADRSVGPPETLTVKIVMVNPARHILVVRDASGIPLDMLITHTTRIRSGDHRLSLGDLSSDIGKSVNLRYIPERRGDVARSIRLNG